MKTAGAEIRDLFATLARISTSYEGVQSAAQVEIAAQLAEMNDKLERLIAQLVNLNLEGACK